MDDDRQAVQKAARNQQVIETALVQSGRELQEEYPDRAEIELCLKQMHDRLPEKGMEGRREQYDSLTQYSRMLEQLEQIDNRRWELSEDKHNPDAEYARINYPIVFRKYGIDVETGPPVKLAEGQYAVL